MKIVITGGHHTTAFAVVDELKKSVRHLDILWLGHKYSMPKDKAESAEFISVANRQIKFVDLKAGKFYRTYHPLRLLKIPLGFIQSFYYLEKFKPDLIFSFGGYLAVPVVLSGWLLRIPSVTHEQTTTRGLANKTLSRFVKRIFISWPDSGKYFPKKKTILTGNPLREAVFKKEKNVHRKLARVLDRSKKTIYITGGKQGSHTINEVVKSILPSLLENYNLILQCGSSTLYNDYSKLKELKNQLPQPLEQRLILKDYFPEGEIGSVYDLCDLVVSRAGANTLYEVAALGKVAIFIPIPWLPYDEQTQNAQILVKAGSAKLLRQKNLTGEKLLEEIKEVFQNFKEYSLVAQKAKSLVKLEAAEKIISELKKLYPSFFL